jgi:hypothetical protein
MSSNTGNINYSLNKNDVYKVLAGCVSYFIPHYFVLIIISMLYIFRIRYQQYYFDDRDKGKEEDRDVLHFFGSITNGSPFNILTMVKAFKKIEDISNIKEIIKVDKYTNINNTSKKNEYEGEKYFEKGKEKNLSLGNLDSKRDWGHSYDYVRAIYKIMQYETPRDWIVATGNTRSVRELCDYVFTKLKMNYEEKVKFDPKFLRSEELKYLRGDPSETKQLLNWEPEYTFETMIDEMIEFWRSAL